MNFGFGLTSFIDGSDIGPGMKNGNNVYLNLSAFNEDGSLKHFVYNNVPIRAQNIGCTFEHEWIAHLINDVGDGAERHWPYQPGPAESIVNGFRKEIGLENFQALNYSTESGYFKYFGNPSVLIGQDIKAQMKTTYETLYKDYYRFLLKGETVKPPTVPFNYIFKLPIQSR